MGIALLHTIRVAASPFDVASVCVVAWNQPKPKKVIRWRVPMMTMSKWWVWLVPSEVAAVAVAV
jgi:hypothetical protein